MAIAFVGAGTGAEQTTAGTTTVSKTGCTAGNIIIYEIFAAGNTGDFSASNHVNIEALDGTDNSTNTIRNSVNTILRIGRAMTTGTCSIDMTCGASGEDVAGRIYEFSGVSLATTTATVVENGAGLEQEAGFTTGTTVSDAFVTTNGADRLALQFVHLRTSQAVGDFTGETGGDWTEVVAEYAATALTLQLQTAVIASAGTIDGGTLTVSSTYWQTLGTALIPQAAPSSQGGQRLLTLGVG